MTIQVLTKCCNSDDLKCDENEEGEAPQLVVQEAVIDSDFGNQPASESDSYRTIIPKNRN